MPGDISAGQQIAISRLLEDESLTGGLDDAPARVLLDWGVEQIEAGLAGDEVRRWVRHLAQVVRDRCALTPQEARRRLQRVVGSSFSSAVGGEAAFAALWAEQEALPPAEWARRLAALAVQALQGTAEAEVSSPVPPSQRTVSPDADGGAVGAKDEGDPSPWWQFWRRRL